MKRATIFALALLALLIGTAIAQDPLVVKMPGSDRENVVVPRTIAFVTGLDITETIVGPLTGERTLGGYTINLDSKPCLLTQVSPAGIVFLVPANVRPSGVLFDRERVLHLQGPSTLRFVEVIVERFAPILQKQGDYAIAAAGIFPQLYIGEPIPVGPARFNYVSLIARGIVTGLHLLEPQLQLTVILERSGERHELLAEAFDFPGFPGTERVTFWAPICVTGDYLASVTIDGHTSNSAMVRFSSDCPARVARPKELGRRR
jgi:hypothetical protein